MAPKGMKAMQIMKKPAGAGTVAGLKRSFSEWAEAGEDVANQPLMKKPSSLALGGENKNEPVKATHKDRGKQRYFDLNKHELPSKMISLVEQARCQEKGRMINNMVYRDEHGNYSFNLENKYIDDKLCKYEDHFGLDGYVCKPKGLVEQMWGGAENIRQAVENGEVDNITAEDSNAVCYKWRELATGKNVGCRRELHVGQHGQPDAEISK